MDEDEASAYETERHITDTCKQELVAFAEKAVKEPVADNDFMDRLKADFKHQLRSEVTTRVRNLVWENGKAAAKDLVERVKQDVFDEIKEEMRK